MDRLSFHHISTVYNVLKALSNLPNIPRDVHQLGSSMLPAELFLAAPNEWWLETQSPITKRFVKACDIFVALIQDQTHINCV